MSSGPLPELRAHSFVDTNVWHFRIPPLFVTSYLPPIPSTDESMSLPQGQLEDEEANRRRSISLYSTLYHWTLANKYCPGQPPPLGDPDYIKRADGSEELLCYPWTPPDSPYPRKDLSGIHPIDTVVEKWPGVEMKIPQDIRECIPVETLMKLKASADGTELVSQIADWAPGFFWFLCGKLTHFPFLVINLSGKC